MNKSNTLHIAFGVDENYIHPMGITIQSILTHNPNNSFVFHVFCSQPSKKEKYNLELMAKQSNCEIHIHEPKKIIDISSVKAKESPAHINEATFHRLFIPKALSKITDRVLYLDADILCNGKLDGLPLDNTVPVFAVKEEMAEYSKAKLAEFNIQLSEYFNAGVLWINIPCWQKYKITEQALQVLNHPCRRLPYFDQDALNIVLKDHIKFLDNDWNYQYGLKRELSRQCMTLDIPEKIRLVHFVGPMKPWRNWNPHDSRDLFLKYQHQTPWCQYPLDNNLNAREERIYTRFQYRQNMRKYKWLQALKWYIRFRKLPKNRTK